MDWKAYSATKAQSSALTGGKGPHIFEYACIQLVDNAALAILVLLIFIFAGVGAYLNTRESPTIVAVAGWFFDAAKLCLGVFLGVWSQRKKK